MMAKTCCLGVVDLGNFEDGHLRKTYLALAVDDDHCSEGGCCRVILVQGGGSGHIGGAACSC